MKSNLEKCREILLSMNLSHFPVMAVANLYRSGITICQGQYNISDGTEIEIEIGLRNDWDQSLALLDRVLTGFTTSKPCALARRVTFKTDEDYLLLTQKLARILLAGFYAWHSEALQHAFAERSRIRKTGNRLVVIPCLDSDGQAQKNREILDIDRRKAASLGDSAVKAIRNGQYEDAQGQIVSWADHVQKAIASKFSFAPDVPAPHRERAMHPVTRIQVSNQTTFQAARHLLRKGLNPLALNFANGIQPGGGFLVGSRAQEEVLCRSSALYATLEDDPMYAFHAKRPEPDSSEWAIHSPVVPVFRTDDGSPLSEPWLLDVITCAAPVAARLDRERAADLLQKRISRILALAEGLGYDALVLGAWGCGAFGNDPDRTARDFLNAIQVDFRGAFSDIIFAIADWSPERKFLGPFRDVFKHANHMGDLESDLRF